SFRRLWMADRPVPAHLDIDDLRAGDPSLQVASDGLDLGKLRYARSVAYPPALDGDGGDRLQGLIGLLRRDLGRRLLQAPPGAVVGREVSVHLLPVGADLHVDLERDVE